MGEYTAEISETAGWRSGQGRRLGIIYVALVSRAILNFRNFIIFEEFTLNDSEIIRLSCFIPETELSDFYLSKSENMSVCGTVAFSGPTKHPLMTGG
jgi:hypothetical protein